MSIWISDLDPDLENEANSRSDLWQSERSFGITKCYCLFKLEADSESTHHLGTPEAGCIPAAGQI